MERRGSLLTGVLAFAAMIVTVMQTQAVPILGVAGYGFGASILRASVEYLLPATLSSMLAAPAGGILVGRLGGRRVLALSGAIGAAGFGWLALAHDATGSVIAASVVIGVAISFAYAAMPALIAANVPHHQSGIANGINSISRTVGSSLASAIITTLLTAKLLPHLPLPQDSQFIIAFWVGAAACAATVLAALLGLRPEGRDAAVGNPGGHGAGNDGSAVSFDRRDLPTRVG
ncbi:MFS transporter [Nocardia nova]|uniref:MFS transporter n=1 Tax=Nocardia nova TaxID=37330 RepID=UPI002157EFD3|nr:MFS transporter [Nocardia nova]